MKRLALYIVVVIGLSYIPAYAVVGDVNNDGSVDLRDVIVSLKVCGEFYTIVTLSGDVNGDSKIGLHEAIYGLTFLAESLDREYPTGNEDFRKEDAEFFDPMFNFRGDFAAFGDNNNLPSSKDYSSFMPDVASQGNTGSCTAWATGYYFKTYQEAVEEGWNKNENKFSPMYLYSMQCKNYQATELCTQRGNCTPWSVLTSWEILKTYGCAKWSSKPYTDYGLFYSPNNNPEKEKYAAEPISESIHEEARKYRAGEKTEFYSLYEVKQALTAGPVIFSIFQYDASHLGNNPSPENNYLISDPSKGGGHAILCVGYDDSKFGTGALKVINSWGKNWAIDGYTWIKYSDYGNIIRSAMTMKDLQNPGGGGNTQTRPDAPTDVQATKNAGPYVDITWSKVSNASYYRIFRAEIDDPSTYTEVGTTNSTSHRDNPAPNIKFYYSVVSFNDIGESEHYSSDTDDESYTDIGIAKGSTLQKPKVSWTYNDDNTIASYFIVADIDSAATMMEVFVALSSEGPWSSLGWIGPEEFYITWGEGSEYVGKQPFIKIVVSSSDGVSESSDPVQVGEEIVVPSATVAEITSFVGEGKTDYIQLSWDTDGGSVDYFEIWRYKAASDYGNDWTLIGYAGMDENVYDDYSAQPGVSYNFYIFPVYQGNYGIGIETDDLSIPIQKANLYLSEANYSYGEITNPVFFKLIVWNSGGSAVNDYAVSIRVYDYDEGKDYYPFNDFKASDFSGQLPLNPYEEHELFVSLELPSWYADGHYYSWIIEVNPYQEIDEVYYDDNIVWSNDGWWSYSLNPEYNLKLETITYDYGELTNPVHFDLEVWNTGGIEVYDYTIRIEAYDWDEDVVYAPFEDFRASDVVSWWWELPLSGGYNHTLSFDLNIPSGYADGHYYFWVISVDPDNEIAESVEEDNSMWADSAWQLSSYGRSSSSEPKKPGLTSPFEGHFNADKFQSMPTVNVTDGSETARRGIRERSGQSLNSKIGSTRPFSKKRIINQRMTREKEKPYAGPIRFKKPPFCINHAE